MFTPPPSHTSIPKFSAHSSFRNACLGRATNLAVEYSLTVHDDAYAYANAETRVFAFCHAQSV